ncbi:hypothetical protein [Rhizobium sp. RU36D]|nr:hypothetical protein [Rhizobium sp. RU36D]SMD16375.1 hypothetical protein SAMN05880593_12966 [Rhizobium sp. RU36D]
MNPNTTPELPPIMKIAFAASRIAAVVPMFAAAALVNAALPRKGSSR